MKRTRQLGQTTTRTGLVASLIAIFLIAVALWWYVSNTPSPASKSTTTGGYITATSSAEEKEVRDTVTFFGQQFKNVSLTGTSQSVKGAIAQYYAPYVSNELLIQWQNATSTSPGRLTSTSSSSPDRIDITSVTKSVDNSYTVTGNVVEVTQENEATTSAKTATTYPVKLILQYTNNKWLITEYRRLP